MNKNPDSESVTPPKPRVALFVTCLVDLFRPSVGFASLELLQRAHCDVYVPQRQTCCGQPAYNNGDYNSARPLAQKMIEEFEPADYVVVPSGSCAGMIKVHYPKLFDGEWQQRAELLGSKTYELTDFLHSVAPALPRRNKQQITAGVAYHDGCAGLRELNVREQPRELLKSLNGIEVQELQQRDTCCGFGGTFCAKMPDISARMADSKLQDATDTGANILCGGDLGCLLSLSGRASRQGHSIEIRHVAELLNGDLSAAAIGESN